MKIAIANDHHGVNKKNMIIKYLKNKGYQVTDLGTNDTNIVDFPQYSFEVSNMVIDKKVDLGILICGTGIGMSIAANRVKGIRCAKINNVKDARFAKEHNSANVLAIPSYLTNFNIKRMLDTFIKQVPSKLDRYRRRNEMLDEYNSEDHVG